MKSCRPGRGLILVRVFFNKPNEFFFLLLFSFYQLALQFKVRSCFSNVYFALNINIYNVFVFGNILRFYLSFPFKYKKNQEVLSFVKEQLLLNVT